MLHNQGCRIIECHIIEVRLYCCGHKIDTWTTVCQTQVTHPPCAQKKNEIKIQIQCKPQRQRRKLRIPRQTWGRNQPTRTSSTQRGIYCSTYARPRAPRPHTHAVLAPQMLSNNRHIRAAQRLRSTAHRLPAIATDSQLHHHHHRRPALRLLARHDASPPILPRLTSTWLRPPDRVSEPQLELELLVRRHRGPWRCCWTPELPALSSRAP
jgi:hypothetical protein